MKEYSKSQLDQSERHFTEMNANKQYCLKWHKITVGYSSQLPERVIAVITAFFYSCTYVGWAAR